LRVKVDMPLLACRPSDFEVWNVISYTDMIPQMSEDLKEMKGDIKEMKGDAKAVRITTDATFEEIKGQREDNQPGYGMSMRQVLADIQAIKERLGML